MLEKEPRTRILNQTVSRRDLLKGAIVLSGGALLAEACGSGIREFSSTPEQRYPLIWEKSFGEPKGVSRLQIDGDTIAISRPLADEIIYLDKYTGKIIKQEFLDLIPEPTQEASYIKIKTTNNNIFVQQRPQEPSGHGKKHLEHEHWQVFATDTLTNQEIWLQQDYIFPEIFDDVVVARNTIKDCGDCDYFAAFSLKTGEKLWKRKFGLNGGFDNLETGFYATEGEGAYGSSNDFKLNFNLRRIDLHTGEQYWEKRHFTRSDFAICFWSDAKSLIAISNDDIVSFDVQRGHIYGRLKFEKELFSIDPFTSIRIHFQDLDPAVDFRSVFLPIKGQLIELDRASGKLSVVNQFGDNEPIIQAKRLDDLLIVETVKTVRTELVANEPIDNIIRCYRVR